VVDRRISTLFLSGTLVYALACSMSSVFEKPELEFRGIRIGAIGLGGASIDVVVDVYNPNSYRLGLDRFTYDLTIENVRFGAGEIETPVSVDGRSTVTVRLPLDLDWSRLGDVGRRVLDRGSVEYRVSGELTIATGFGRRRIPYAKAGRLSVLGKGDR
jgi:LEA14-like dessication related protein